ncbi:YgfZ/GcvT domain-containing protein [Corynebacterium caspium]|uniref:CAF17-like 4Fe-4S cluster assembly/insertion protein YgfZ n=1 Tax=Corynebacterium caspium TaxID=234828 RepID=UPI000380652F|nr:folate-binding protein YgfZ [Corynebacterium caspium]WKD58751.1 tRNA-modifying protein YgfZ [Corynebacterium caspium DSM 44850]
MSINTDSPDTSYTSPLLSRPGAVSAQPEDPHASALDAAGVAWHYGAPLEEQRQLSRGPIVIDRSQRTVLEISGPDAPQFLNNLLSQKLDDAPSGFSASALDLDINGRVLHYLQLSRIDNSFYLDLPAAAAISLKSFLERMVFWSKVSIKTTDLGILTILGKNFSLPENLPGLLLAREVEWAGPARTDLLITRTELIAATARLEANGLKLAGLMAFTAERVKALEPELPVDLDDKSIPHEVYHWIGRPELNRIGAVHLEKGCYRGQETVARVENLGRSPRLLVIVHLDGSSPELPTPGTPITQGNPEGRALGRIGTVVHDESYGPIALAILKRSALNRSGLTAGYTALNIDTDSIPTEEGEKAGRAAINRLKTLGDLGVDSLR